MASHITGPVSRSHVHVPEHLKERRDSVYSAASDLDATITDDFDGWQTLTVEDQRDQLLAESKRLWADVTPADFLAAGGAEAKRGNPLRVDELKGFYARTQCLFLEHILNAGDAKEAADRLADTVKLLEDFVAFGDFALASAVAGALKDPSVSRHLLKEGGPVQKKFKKHHKKQHKLLPKLLAHDDLKLSPGRLQDRCEGETCIFPPTMLEQAVDNAMQNPGVGEAKRQQRSKLNKLCGDVQTAALRMRVTWDEADGDNEMRDAVAYQKPNPAKFREAVKAGDRRDDLAKALNDS